MGLPLYWVKRCEVVRALEGIWASSEAEKVSSRPGRGRQESRVRGYELRGQALQARAGGEQPLREKGVQDRVSEGGSPAGGEHGGTRVLRRGLAPGER